jgi:hypothetical protein
MRNGDHFIPGTKPKGSEAKSYGIGAIGYAYGMQVRAMEVSKFILKRLDFLT